MPKPRPRPNRFTLYETAVQSTDVDIDFFPRLFRSRTGRLPLALREDFCGTFSLCTAWASSHARRTALGLDLAKAPLAHGRKHHLGKLPAAARKRVTIRRQNVKSRTKPADLIVAQNFSYFTFHSRDDLIRYFKYCHASLVGDGMLLVDIFGGPEAETLPLERKRFRDPRTGSFEYFWELHDFNPIDRIANFSIHFRLSDGTALPHAFRYRWRLWTIPEVREMMRAAGFQHTEVLWEDDDGNNIRTERAENEPTWLAYIIAGKRKWRHA